MIKLQNFKLLVHGRSVISNIFLQISLASEQMLQVCRFREMWLEFSVRDISSGQRITSCNIDIRQGPNHATLHKTLKLISRKVIKVAWHYRCQENCKCIFPEFHEVYVLVKISYMDLSLLILMKPANCHIHENSKINISDELLWR